MRRQEPKDAYGEPIIVERPCGTARVFKPTLTPEEYERRRKEAEPAAAAVLIELEMQRRKRAHETEENEKSGPTRPQ